MEFEKSHNINDTVTSNNKTMEYNTNITKSILNQTATEVDYDSNMEHEAIVLFRKAERKLSRKCCIFSLCTSRHETFSQALDLFKKAGDKYKIVNHWKRAGMCYENCALIKLKLKEKPIYFYKQSYYCYSKIDIGNDSKQIFEKMNLYLEKEGEYFQVGKNNENLAIQKENKKKYNEAIDYYLKALKYYEKDGKHEPLKINIQIKLAELMMLYNHPDAPKKVPTMLENIGVNYLKNPITKYAAKDYFGKAILCNIYYRDNPSEGKIYIEKYKKIDKTFEESTIYNLCSNILNSIENKNYNKLKKDIHQYKELTEVDDFTDDILDKIVEKIKKIYNIEESLTLESNNYTDGNNGSYNNDANNNNNDGNNNNNDGNNNNDDGNNNNNNNEGNGNNNNDVNNGTNGNIYNEEED